jgi:flavodoxin
MLLKSLLLLCSYHQKNTEKIGKAIAEVLDAQIKTPLKTNPEEIQDYSLIGFGSGIYSGQHHKTLLDFIDRLPRVENKNAFIFSTYGAPAFIANKEFIQKNHQQLRDKLLSKGYKVIGEFGCAGFNTNSFLKLFGGLNRGKPDAEDLNRAKAFARNLINGAFL